MKKFTLLAFSIACVIPCSFAQIGGSSIFSFLDLSTSARIAALGGAFIAVRDNDPNPATMNPSLLNSSMNNMVSFSGVKYYADINGGDASFTKTFEKLGTFQAAAHYINYGHFKSTDIYGNINGEFTAADYAFQLGWGYRANPYFTVGSNLKFIYSHLEEYTSTGIAGDIGITYSADSVKLGWVNRGLTISLLARNVGTQLKNYNEYSEESEPIKPEVLIGFYEKFLHAPFRLITVYRHLEQFDLSYKNPLDDQIDPLTGEKTIKEITFLDKLLQHFILGVEMEFSKNFSLRAAYNFQRRNELKIENAPGLTGMSFGFGLKVNRFYLSYAHAVYHRAGGSNFLTVSTSPWDFFRKASVTE